MARVYRGSCHCGAVGFEYRRTPEWLTSCNCSFCRRAGALWAYAEMRQIDVRGDPEETFRYVWGDRTLAFHICRTCGCTACWTSLQPAPEARMGVNFALVDPADRAGLRIRHLDGADTWQWLD
jgi:hypothetical protein